MHNMIKSIQTNLLMLVFSLSFIGLDPMCLFANASDLAGWVSQGKAFGQVAQVKIFEAKDISHLSRIR